MKRDSPLAALLPVAADNGHRPVPNGRGSAAGRRREAPRTSVGTCTAGPRVRDAGRAEPPAGVAQAAGAPAGGF